MLNETESTVYASQLRALLDTKLASKVSARDFEITMDRVLHGVTARELAEDHGITAPRIFQIEARVLRYAKRALNS
jgi:DNA-directed RNA polymerase sigma subunit (sigma70/sigma32)